MTANIWNHSEWVSETDPSTLKTRGREIIKEAGFGVLDFMEYHFQPQGYTAIWLLCESHFAVHTFPEFGKTYIELSSCNRQYFVKFLELLEIYKTPMEK